MDGKHRTQSLVGACCLEGTLTMQCLVLDIGLGDAKLKFPGAKGIEIVH